MSTQPSKKPARRRDPRQPRQDDVSAGTQPGGPLQRAFEQAGPRDPDADGTASDPGRTPDPRPTARKRETTGTIRESDARERAKDANAAKTSKGRKRAADEPES